MMWFPHGWGGTSTGNSATQSAPSDYNTLYNDLVDWLREHTSTRHTHTGSMADGTIRVIFQASTSETEHYDLDEWLMRRKELGRLDTSVDGRVWDIYLREGTG